MAEWSGHENGVVLDTFQRHIRKGAHGLAEQRGHARGVVLDNFRGRQALEQVLCGSRASEGPRRLRMSPPASCLVMESRGEEWGQQRPLMSEAVALELSFGRPGLRSAPTRPRADERSAHRPHMRHGSSMRPPDEGWTTSRAAVRSCRRPIQVEASPCGGGTKARKPAARCEPPIRVGDAPTVSEGRCRSCLRPSA